MQNFKGNENTKKQGLIKQGEYMKKILQGNEAIARGAWEAGVMVAE
jgi:TPP-dependent indolepyruvate ferredoxin oxidoreductase alpha subunit